MALQSKQNQNLLNSGKSFLAGYLVSGYPSIDEFLKVSAGCVTAGLDIFEIGFPSANPYLDGEVIQQAHRKSKHDHENISTWRQIRQSLNCPLWMMGYKADLLKNNFYLELAKNECVDCFVLPELTIQERIHFQSSIENYPIDVMGFVHPGMSAESVCNQAENFELLYFQLYSGPTGINGVGDDYLPTLNLIRENYRNFIFAGFGINTPEKAATLISDGFDGVIIGTAMIKKLNQSSEDLFAFVNDIKNKISGDANL